jgi:DNA-binding LacI/PurR family transcriptional regulator
VSVVGFDDMAESDSFWPPLTTIHQEFEAIGRRAVQLLIAEIEERPEPVRSSVMDTRLVVRASTAPPAATADS